MALPIPWVSSPRKWLVTTGFRAFSGSLFGIRSSQAVKTTHICRPARTIRFLQVGNSPGKFPIKYRHYSQECCPWKNTPSDDFMTLRLLLSHFCGDNLAHRRATGATLRDILYPPHQPCWADWLRVCRTKSTPRWVELLCLFNSTERWVFARKGFYT